MILSSSSVLFFAFFMMKLFSNLKMARGLLFILLLIASYLYGSSISQAENIGEKLLCIQQISFADQTHRPVHIILYYIRFTTK